MRNLHYIQIPKGNTEQTEIFTKLMKAYESELGGSNTTDELVERIAQGHRV